FLRWILKGDFAAPVKEIARRFLPEEERAVQPALPLDAPQPSLPLDLPGPQGTPPEENRGEQHALPLDSPRPPVPPSPSQSQTGGRGDGETG
ncbi:MAG TPA: hypothetical protein VEO37_08220, partial [Thermoanaerobaculia bacterium]|nr:hypothetical protein [Thermoanaerobaculia bacterium]